MRRSTYMRLASAQAALSLTDLMASARASLTDRDRVEPESKAAESSRTAEIKVAIAGRVKDLAPPAKKHNVGRNEPCPCGSGVKFKRCCIRKG